MDINRAKEIIHCLADGVDPLTGEVLSSNHVCNQPDVIRALHVAERALQKDLARPEDGPWHKEYGKVWSPKETNMNKLYIQNSKLRTILKALGEGFDIVSMDRSHFRFIFPICRKSITSWKREK